MNATYMNSMEIPWVSRTNRTIVIKLNGFWHQKPEICVLSKRWTNCNFAARNQEQWMRPSNLLRRVKRERSRNACAPRAYHRLPNTIWISTVFAAWICVCVRVSLDHSQRICLQTVDLQSLLSFVALFWLSVIAIYF